MRPEEIASRQGDRRQHLFLERHFGKGQSSAKLPAKPRVLEQLVELVIKHGALNKLPLKYSARVEEAFEHYNRLIDEAFLNAFELRGRTPE